MSEKVTPEYILKMKSPSERFLCPLSANTYGIQFKSFSIGNFETKETLFDTEHDTINLDTTISTCSASDPDAFRAIRFSFPEGMLKIPSIATW
jgi:hypothetical protein